VALELSKLAGQVNQMGRTMVERQTRCAALIARARATLAEHGAVTQELRDKVARARNSDQSWRGAEPYSERMDERCLPKVDPCTVTLIAVDGSQVYPDRHGIATYYLLNTGSIVLRQGSGQAPVVEAVPVLFFEDNDLYDEAGHLRDLDHINRLRDHQEIERLADLAQAERSALGGDLARSIVVLSDGPLLPWIPQRSPNDNLGTEVTYLVGQLDRMRKAHALPVGYVDRPNSAYVLRTLELADLALAEIDREAVRKGCYRLLADRLLFADLEPNQRSALFASTSEINRRYAEKGHRIIFFYVNVARHPGAQNAVIARVELPEWVAGDPATLDLVHQAIYGECALTSYPYVLARAHELAVVGTAERANLESMLEQTMLRCGLHPATSIKAREKHLLSGKARR
jgi:hypothetical protein